MDEDKGMTYRELLAKLQGLDQQQLDMEVIWTGDERGGKVGGLMICEEDWYDPDQEGAAPISQYDEPWRSEILASEKPVARKGQPWLMVD